MLPCYVAFMLLRVQYDFIIKGCAKLISRSEGSII